MILKQRPIQLYLCIICVPGTDDCPLLGYYSWHIYEQYFHHIEAIELICRVNESTGFCMFTV